MKEQNIEFLMDQATEPEKSKSFLRRVNDKLQSRLEGILPTEKVNASRSALESARNYEIAGFRSDSPLVDKLYSPIRKLLEEPSLTVCLATMYLGEVSVKGAEKKGRKSPIGSFLVNTPVALQAASELRRFIETKSEDLASEGSNARQEYGELAQKFGLKPDSRLFNDPRIVEYLCNSFMLWPAYGEFVKYTGIPIQAALSALFILQPTMNEFISRNAITVDLAAIATSAVLLCWRAEQEAATIREKGYNPDFLQTASVILTSKVNEDGSLRRDIRKWVWIVDTVDLAKVAVVYTIPVAWNEHLLAASLLANIPDMLYHGTFNLAVRKDVVSKVKGMIKR